MKERLIKCKSLISGRIIDVPESQVLTFEGKTLEVLKDQPRPRDMRHEVLRGHGGVDGARREYSGKKSLM